MPMKMSHRPPTKAPVKICRAPKSIRTMAKPFPTFEAVLVACVREPERYHKKARKTLSPSSGKPGIRLNIPTAILIQVRYEKMACAKERGRWGNVLLCLLRQQTRRKGGAGSSLIVEQNLAKT